MTSAGWTRVVGLVGLMLIGATLVVAFMAVTGPHVRGDGPLQPNATTNLEFALTSEETVSWGIDMPPNRTNTNIVFRSAELMEPVGLSILGVTMNRPNSGSLINAYGYPPPGMEVFPVEGSTLPAGGSILVVVGVKLADDATEGTVKGLRVRYATGGQEFEVVLEYSLRLTLKTD